MGFAVAEIKIDWAAAVADLSACVALRQQVFCQQQGVPIAREQDGLDAAARHVVAKIGDAVIGTARVRQVGAAVKIERVAVRQDYRGQKIGRQIMEFILAQAGDHVAATYFSLSAQRDALAFYHALGFVAEGDVFMDAGIAHQNMIMKIGH